MPQGIRGRNQVSLPIILLMTEMMRVGFDHIPPVTLSTILAQLAIFLKLVKVPHIKDVCISAVHVWYYEDWMRLVYAAFFHVSDWHLYYNMVSFLWKGLTLERRLGSKYFLYVIAVFAALTNAMTVALAVGAEEILNQSEYLHECAVGFSGVLFALKVVTTHMLPPGVQYVMGWFPVPSRIACWVELLIIHLLVPGSSFIGHLSGILIGLLYIKGPLKPLMDVPFHILFPQDHGTNYQARTPGRSSYWSQYFSGSGTTQSTQPTRPTQSASSRSPAPESTGRYDHHRYTGGMTEEEQIEEALRRSMRQDPSSTTGQRVTPSAPPLDDVFDYGYSRGPAVPSPSQSYSPSSPTLPPQEPPPSYQRLYPDLTAMEQDEMRRRRVQRFQNSS